MAEEKRHDDQHIEQMLCRAVSQITPDAFDGVRAELGTQQKGAQLAMKNTNQETAVSQKNEKKTPRAFRYIAAIAAALILLIGGVAGGNYYVNQRVASVATLDVNPSVEIELNRKDTVLRVNALNSDGEAIIGQMDFRGQTLEMTINALIGSMVRGGYLSDIANSILISVDSGDTQKAQTLQRQISDAVLDFLGDDSGLSGSVLSQTLSKDDELQALADRYGISRGKAQLIRQITAQNSFYTFEELAPLTVNELNLISESGGLTLENVNADGPASDKAYIGVEKAKALALTAAGATEAGVTNHHCEMEYKMGTMVYEVEFDYNGMEYEIYVDAVTGTVLHMEQEAAEHYQGGEHHDAHHTEPTATPDSYLGEAKARTLALAHAGLTDGEITNYRCSVDMENGIPVYEIEFDAGDFEYDYDVHAESGKILRADKEWRDGSQGGQTSGGSTGDAYIGEAKAKEIALAHAGVSADSARKMECELDRENGTVVYEIDFEAGGYEYAYDVDALTGSILKYDKERD